MFGRKQPACWWQGSSKKGEMILWGESCWCDMDECGWRLVHKGGTELVQGECGTAFLQIYVAIKYKTSILERTSDTN